jgi:hypothetical protein
MADQKAVPKADRLGRQMVFSKAYLRADLMAGSKALMRAPLLVSLRVS